MNRKQQSPSGPASALALLQLLGRREAAALRCTLSLLPGSAPGSALNPGVKTPTKRSVLLVQEAPCSAGGEAEKAQGLALLTSRHLRRGKRFKNPELGALKHLQIFQSSLSSLDSLNDLLRMGEDFLKR